MYTYKDLKIAVLQKLDETHNTMSGTITATTLVEEYIAAIPALLNEALQYCSTAGRFIIKTITITQSVAGTGLYMRYNLTDKAADFYSLLERQIYFDNGTTYTIADNYTIEGDRQFVAAPSIIGTWTIYYNSYPQNIVASAIIDTTLIDVASEVFAMLALHISGEILLATGGDYAITRKSEFEQRLQALKDNTVKQAKVTVIADDFRRLL